MKKILMVAMLIMPVMTGNLFARQAKTALRAGNVQSLQNGSGYLNNIKTKAARDFAERFPEADGKWYTVKNGFLVRFVQDSITIRVAYNLRGNWTYTIKQYQEKVMPKEVRHLVKTSYYDFTITLVEEIERPNEPVVYLVHMYDATTWKNVQVRNGEIIVVDEFEKGRP